METVVHGTCPSCDLPLSFLYRTEEIPYFSAILIISARCDSCGYRFVDTQLLNNAEPSRWELDVRNGEDMMVRVVRSTHATIMIPELGVRVDPGPACEGFVSNVEGVLCRIEQVLNGVLYSAEGEERERAVTLLREIGEVREGDRAVTLVIEDPTGNSAILADQARVARLEPGGGEGYDGAPARSGEDGPP